jgi:hypothetical protein
MENQQPYGINYPGDGFQEPLGPGYYSPFQDWQPGEENSMREFSFTPSPNPSFDLGLHALPGSQLPSETSTLQNSISNDSELSPPKIEKVLHITVFPLDRRHLLFLDCSNSFQRRAQNRAAQKAHRQRQASYTRRLELELQELRTKYNKLCSHIRRIKQVIEEMCLEE